MNATHLACLTPAGTGAVATLGLRGPDAWSAVRELAQGRMPAVAEEGGFWLTRLGGVGQGQTDEVVVAVKNVMPELWLELHCHGGREVIRLLSELFCAKGVVVSSWQEFMQPLPEASWRTAAMEVLTQALTTRTAGIALDQCQGALVKALGCLHLALEGNDISHANHLLAELEQHAPVGLHLATPWRIVIAGAPNVGKSSLVNALAGYQRSIVSPLPGTTRDVVTTLLALDGWPVEVADTAGWRSTESPLEREGMARARQAMAGADLCLWLVDASAIPVWPHANLGATRIVINKTDLGPAWPLETVDAVRVSAQTGAGLAELCQAIANWLVPAVPPGLAAVPFTVEQVAALAEVKALVNTGNLREALGRLDKMPGVRLTKPGC